MHSGVAARCSRLELRGEHEEEAKASLGGREGARACWGRRRLSFSVRPSHVLS